MQVSQTTQRSNTKKLRGRGRIDGIVPPGEPKTVISKPYAFATFGIRTVTEELRITYHYPSGSAVC